MRIESISIKNLRCIKDATVNLAPYTCFVGMPIDGVVAISFPWVARVK